MSNRTMYDSVNVAAIPANATMVAGYVDGRYQTVPALRQRFPHAKVVTITVFGEPGAQVADCERGDLTPAQAAQWAKSERLAGRHPTIYCSASPWPSVQQAVRDVGLDPAHDVSWWIAAYDHSTSIPNGAVAHQFTDPGPYDVSSVLDYWPGVDPTPSPPSGHDCAAGQVWWTGHGCWDPHQIPADASGVFTPGGSAMAWWDGHGWTDVHQIPANSPGVHNFTWTATGWKPG